MGTMGNKGSCVMRFNYLDTSLAIACCHFCAGASEVNSRIIEMTDVLTKVLPIKNNNSSNSRKEIKFKDHDYLFLFGDLNFRIDCDMSTCLNLIKSGELEKLALEDQLNKKKSINNELIDMMEPPLKFNPTYKYIPGTSEYDSKKKRVPSWCDRILYKKNKYLQVIDYNKVDYTHSDHKPIYGMYKIQTKKIDKNLKDSIIMDIKENILKKTEDVSKDIGSILFLI